MQNNYSYIDDLFLLKYPDGLSDDEFENGKKRHKNTFKIIELAKNFDLEILTNIDNYHEREAIDFFIKIVTMSSTVSVFEKVAFKNYLADKKTWTVFCESLYDFLTNTNEDTFNNFVAVLAMKKHEKNANPAKWPVITFILQMFHPESEVFVKPTTTKKMLKLLESDVAYQSYPNYTTYSDIKEVITAYKKQSLLVRHQNNIIVQAVIYGALDI